MFFASDNSGPAHPAVMDALIAANSGHMASYGGDEITARVIAQLRALFEAPEAEVFLVPTGSAGNALALSCLSRPWDRVFCAPLAHIEVDECGAVEFYAGGANLTRVPGPSGKMAPDALAAALDASGGSEHNPQKGPVSLTQATEMGTLYSLGEIKALSTIAHQHGCPVHLDGARFANAIATLGCSPADMTWRAGVDAVSFGGTKNGLLGVEAVIFFDPAHAESFRFRRKRAGHLFSKGRYLAAQLEAYLTDGLWLDLAERSNATAARVSAALTQAGARLVHPTEVNMIFAELPVALHERLTAAGVVYHQADTGETPRDGHVHVRLVPDWSLNDAQIAEFEALL